MAASPRFSVQVFDEHDGNHLAEQCATDIYAVVYWDAEAAAFKVLGNADQAAVMRLAQPVIAEALGSKLAGGLGGLFGRKRGEPSA